MSRDKRPKKQEEVGAPHWMTTYGDMVTLLLTFFVLLFTFSSLDVKRFHEVMSAIQHSFMGRSGILMGSVDPAAGEGQRLDAAEAATLQELAEAMGEQEYVVLEMLHELEETYEKVKAFLKEAGLEDDIQLRLEERGIVLELPERILFDSGQAVIKREFLPTLDILVGLLAEIPNQVIVEGHTDNVPIRTFFYPSNWELSVARSVSVARYLIDMHNINPRRLVATGYGEHHPIDTNETAEGRANNRRVTLVISILKVNEV
ncbi:MAG: flagellar motor protein MotB [Bacillota bacterium]